MSMYRYGLLHGMDQDKRIITMKYKKQVQYFYMAKGLFTSFMQYFQPGIYVYLYVSKGTRRYHGYTVYNVESIDKIMSPNRQNPVIYYDISFIKTGIKSIVNTKKHRMFLDFEMSMPPYRNYEHFVSEIIQVGYVFTDEESNVLIKETKFIKSLKYPEISDRTKKFLHITQDDVNQGISYQEFYQSFTELISKYKPMVFVWGQNDLIELRKMNGMYDLPDFTRKTQFIDLLKLHKTYYGLKNDLGLFNAYNIYQIQDLDTQKHDALEDAYVTKMVFDSFVEVCNGEKEVHIE